MRLNVQELLCGDGVIPFTCEMDPAGLDFPSISEYLTPITADGKVTSQAGLLTLTGEARASMMCICDRCGTEYRREAVFPLDTVLAAELEDEENPDVFLLQDDCVDMDEVVATAFVLGLDSKLLCRPDCKGVCPQCGHNLNEGPCSCKPEADPRFAALGQLLDDED